MFDILKMYFLIVYTIITLITLRQTFGRQFEGDDILDHHYPSAVYIYSNKGEI